MIFDAPGRPSWKNRISLGILIGGLTYILRSWNLYGNERSSVLLDGVKGLWPALYLITGLFLILTSILTYRGDRQADIAVMLAAMVVVGLSLMRGWAIVGGPNGGWDSLHVLANFIFLAVNIAITWTYGPSTRRK